jgi:hypothetical protein
MFRKAVVAASLVAVGLIFVMMNLTTPAAIGPFGVLVFFTLLYILSFGVASMGIWILFRKMSARRQYVYGTVVGFAPMMLLMVGAFGGIGVWQFVLVLCAEVIACFLISKRL